MLYKIVYDAFKVVIDENSKEIWKPMHRGKLINLRDIEILSKYNAEIRGIYNYYKLADNVSVLNCFAYIMEYSMYKNLCMQVYDENMFDAIGHMLHHNFRRTFTISSR